MAANGLDDLYTLLDAELYKSEQDLPLDAIKCPLSPNSRAEVGRALGYRPLVLLHGWGPPGYSVTRPEIPGQELLRELSTLSHTPYLSVHLDPDPALDGELDRSILLERVVEQAGRLRQLSGLPLLLENVPWRPGTEEIGAVRPGFGTDPDFITAALEVCGAGLLLDLAHARVACFHRGEDVHGYLEALPLSLVRELHVSGPRLEAGGLRDRHLALHPTDWALLDWALERTPGVQWLTHEYAGARPETTGYTADTGPEVLRADLLHLKEKTQ